MRRSAGLLYVGQHGARAPMLPTRTSHMPSRRTSRASSTPSQLAELAIAAPQVAAHRLTRMAIAGPVLSARDRKEFTGMVQEKQLAFVQSWMAMATEAARIQRSLLMSWLSPWSPAAGAKTATLLRGAALRVAARGLAPVHSKAVSNARRLRKTRLK